MIAAHPLLAFEVSLRLPSFHCRRLIRKAFRRKRLMPHPGPKRVGISEANPVRPFSSPGPQYRSRQGLETPVMCNPSAGWPSVRPRRPERRQPLAVRAALRLYGDRKKREPAVPVDASRSVLVLRYHMARNAPFSRARRGPGNRRALICDFPRLLVRNSWKILISCLRSRFALAGFGGRNAKKSIPVTMPHQWLVPLLFKQAACRSGILRGSASPACTASV